LATRFEFFKTTLAGCPGTPAFSSSGLIVSHFLWPVFRISPAGAVRTCEPKIMDIT